MVNSFRDRVKQYFNWTADVFISPQGDPAVPTATTPVVSPINPIHTLVAPPPALPSSVAAIATKITSPVISIMNLSSILTDAEVRTAIAAIQVQLDRDFSPVWGMSATLHFIPRTTTLPISSWLVNLMDNSDQQGALGYHDLTTNGLPIAKIFAKDDLKYGLSWTVTLSHEILEMVTDPFIANCMFAQDSNTTGSLYAWEIADACEDEACAYRINGILVSDFVYPAWFEGFRVPHSTKFDFTGKIHAPFQLAPGGYISKFVVGPNSQGWSQVMAESVPTMRNKKGVNSRFARRQALRKLRSDVEIVNVNEKPVG